MKRIRKIGGAVVACCVLACVARAEEEWSSTRDSYICRSSTEVVEIKTYVSDEPPSESEKGPGCRVDYVRSGITRTLWSSRTSRSYCNGKAANLIAKLEAGVFSCKPLHLE